MRNLFIAIAAVLGTTAMVTAAPAPIKKALAKEVKTAPVKEAKKAPVKDEKTAPTKEVKKTKHPKHSKKVKAAETETSKAETANMKK